MLYHKTYREKFLDFLKIDFPKIPFVKSKESFLKMSELGQKLINLHLMKADLQNLDSIGAPFFENINNHNEKNEKIEKITYNIASKKLFVNENLYFSDVSEKVWEYKIGGYQVLDKYLKSHKNENIDYAHFEKIIKILYKSLAIESAIEKIEIT